MRPLATLLATVLTLELSGCASTRVPVLAPEPKPDVGTLGMALAPQSADGSFQRPAVVGAGQGAKEGAKVGAMAAVIPGWAVAEGGARSDLRFFAIGMALLIVGAAVAPATAGIGAAIGALTAPSEGRVERSEAALDRALVDASLHDTLIFRIMQAGERRPIFSGADPVLALDGPQVWLSSGDPTQWRPDLRLRVTVRGRLLGASGGAELGTWTWEHEGRRANFFEWGENDAKLLREELERARRALAVRIVSDLY